MKIIDFSHKHTEDAIKIAKSGYENERQRVPALPPSPDFPDLTPYADNGLGVAAFDGDVMLGFLCVVSPFKNAFRSTDAVGVFSPMGANGACQENRAEIYARMYQAAGIKWAKAGASSHAVCLYAGDKIVQEQFFRYGFGLRSIDAIRLMESINPPECHGFTFSELTQDEYPKVLPLDHMLDAHMAASPTFILRPSRTEKEFVENAARSNSRFFIAGKADTPIAFLKVEVDGDNFLQSTPKYLHITGAFCLPEFRGTGVYPCLLDFVIRTLKNDGYERFGVDFESINPTAYRFWPKHFGVYTNSVTRRIDEHALNM